MNREKQIEEIKTLNLLLEDITVNKVLFTSDGEAIDVITVNAVEPTVTNQLANILINAGYRKASDVAREVIDNILSKIRTMIREIEKVERNGNSYFSEFNGGSKTALEIVSKDIAELKKKYESEKRE